MAKVFENKGTKKRPYKGPNKWWIDFTDADGRRHREPAAPTRSVAETILAKKLVNVAEGKHLDKEIAVATTVEQLAAEYVEKYVKLYLDTYKVVKSHLRYILPVKVNGIAFAKHLIAKVTGPDIAGVIGHLKVTPAKEGGKLRSPATLNRYRTTLEGMFTFGITWKRIKENPVKDVPKFFERKKKTVFADTSLWLRLQAAASDWLRPMIQLAGVTGMREGEMLAIKVEDINLDACTIDIRENKEKDNEKFVALSEPAVKLIREILARPRPADCPWLFFDEKVSSRAAGRMNVDSSKSAFYKAWRVAKKAAGVERPWKWNELYKRTPEEMAAVLAAAPEWLRPMIQVGAAMRLLTQELANLALEDVQGDRLKTDRLTVIIPAEVLPLIEAQVAAAKAAGSQFVFFVPGFSKTGPAGQVKAQSGSGRFRSEWDACREAAGAPAGFIFHSLRHTCASHMAMAGASQKDIQEQLNHSRASTSDRYMHLSPIHRQAAINRVNPTLPLGSQMAVNGFEVVEANEPKDDSDGQLETNSKV